MAMNQSELKQYLNQVQTDVQHAIDEQNAKHIALSTKRANELRQDILDLQQEVQTYLQGKSSPDWLGDAMSPLLEYEKKLANIGLLAPSGAPTPILAKEYHGVQLGLDTIEDLGPSKPNTDGLTPLQQAMIVLDKTPAGKESQYNWQVTADNTAIKKIRNSTNFADLKNDEQIKEHVRNLDRMIIAYVLGRPDNEAENPIVISGKDEKSRAILIELCKLHQFKFICDIRTQQVSDNNLLILIRDQGRLEAAQHPLFTDSPRNPASENFGIKKSATMEINDNNSPTIPLDLSIPHVPSTLNKLPAQSSNSQGRITLPEPNTIQWPTKETEVKSIATAPLPPPSTLATDGQIDKNWQEQMEQFELELVKLEVKLENLEAPTQQAQDELFAELAALQIKFNELTIESQKQIDANKDGELIQPKYQEMLFTVQSHLAELKASLAAAQPRIYETAQPAVEYQDAPAIADQRTPIVAGYPNIPGIAAGAAENEPIYEELKLKAPEIYKTMEVIPLPPISRGYEKSPDAVIKHSQYQALNPNAENRTPDPIEEQRLRDLKLGAAGVKARNEKIGYGDIPSEEEKSPINTALGEAMAERRQFINAEDEPPEKTWGEEEIKSAIGAEKENQVIEDREKINTDEEKANKGEQTPQISGDPVKLDTAAVIRKKFQDFRNAQDLKNPGKKPSDEDPPSSSPGKNRP